MLEIKKQKYSACEVPWECSWFIWPCAVSWLSSCDLVQSVDSHLVRSVDCYLVRSVYCRLVQSPGECCVCSRCIPPSCPDLNEMFEFECFSNFSCAPFSGLPCFWFAALCNLFACYTELISNRSCDKFFSRDDENGEGGILLTRDCWYKNKDISVVESISLNKCIVIPFAFRLLLLAVCIMCLQFGCVQIKYHMPCQCDQCHK